MQNWRRNEWVQEVKVDVDTAVGTGYGESKRVCELVWELFIILLYTLDIWF